MVRFSSPKRLRREGGLSRCFYSRVNDGGRRSWRSTGQVSLKAAKETVELWRLREARGERHVEEIHFDLAAKAWLEAKELKVDPRVISVYRVYLTSWVRHFGSKQVRSLEAKDFEH